MLKSLINECRFELSENDETPEPDNKDPGASYKSVRLNKIDRAANKVGKLLSMDPAHLSRRQMRKMLPHLSVHFTKGYGKGEGDAGVVDAHDLATLGRYAEKLSAHAHGMKRMCGPAHQLASSVCGHVAGAHERMSGHHRGAGAEKDAEHHSAEHDKYKTLARAHRLIARRHGYYDGEY